MAFTAEELRKALSLATVVTEKSETKVEIDFEKVCVSLLGDMSEISKSDGDPSEALADLSEKLDSLDDLIGKCSETDEGKIMVSPNLEVAKGYLVEGIKTKKAKVEKNDDTGEEEGEVEKNDTDLDLSDEIDWDHDLSPSTPPTLRSERFTKRERPMVSRRASGGRRDQMEKYDRARERAMGRSAASDRALS